MWWAISPKRGSRLANSAAEVSGWEVLRDLSTQMLVLAEAGDYVRVGLLDAERRRILFALAQRRVRDLPPALAEHLGELQAQILAVSERSLRAEANAAGKAKLLSGFTQSV